jgi:hypothetical protein
MLLKRESQFSSEVHTLQSQKEEIYEIKRDHFEEMSYYARELERLGSSVDEALISVQDFHGLSRGKFLEAGGWEER